MSKRTPYAPTYTITAPKHKGRADGGASTASTVPSKASKSSSQASSDVKQGVVLPTPIPTAASAAAEVSAVDTKAAALRTLDQKAAQASAATRQHRNEIGSVLSSEAGVSVSKLPLKTVFGALTVFGLAIRLYVLIDEQNKRDRATIAEDIAKPIRSPFEGTLRAIQHNAIRTRLAMMEVLNDVPPAIYVTLLPYLKVYDPALERLLRQLSFLNTQTIDDVIDLHASFR